MQYTFVMPIVREKNLRSVIVFSNVFENFHSRNNPRCDLSKVCQLRSRRFPKPRISTVFRTAQKNISQISRKSTENRMTKRMGFYKKRSAVCEAYRFGRRVPKEWDLSSTNSTIFRRCPKEYALNRTSRIKLYKNVARSRLYCRKAKRSTQCES